jgi:hypothetical protein
MVYGIDDRFGVFQGKQLSLSGREAAISAALAAELGPRSRAAVKLLANASA